MMNDFGAFVQRSLKMKNKDTARGYVYENLWEKL
jgi:hypothetical protein